MAIFGGITDDALGFLLARARHFAAERGEFFFNEGDAADSMFVLEEGCVDVVKTWQGKEYRLRQLHEGDCFGEVALMDLMPRSASVRAVDRCRAIELPRKALYELHQADPEQFTMIQMNMGREVSRRLREADHRLFEAQRDVSKLHATLPYQAF